MSWIAHTKRACPFCQAVQHFMRKTCIKCGQDLPFREEMEQKRQVLLQTHFVKSKTASGKRSNVNSIKKSLLKYMAKLEGTGNACVLLVIGKEPQFRTSMLTFNDTLDRMFHETSATGVRVLSKEGKGMLLKLKNDYVSAMNSDNPESQSTTAQDTATTAAETPEIQARIETPAESQVPETAAIRTNLPKGKRRPKRKVASKNGEQNGTETVLSEVQVQSCAAITQTKQKRAEKEKTVPLVKTATGITRVNKDIDLSDDRLFKETIAELGRTVGKDAPAASGNLAKRKEAKKQKLVDDCQLNINRNMMSDCSEDTSIDEEISAQDISDPPSHEPTANQDDVERKYFEIEHQEQNVVLEIPRLEGHEGDVIYVIEPMQRAHSSRASLNEAGQILVSYKRRNRTEALNAYR